MWAKAQQKSRREGGSALLQLLFCVGGSFTQPWLAGPASQSVPGEALKCTAAKLSVSCFSSLLMPCASMLTVNSHLKQPCATELSAGNVSEPHRPFKILPWLKWHQSARRDPYLWVRSLREIHSITFFFFFLIPVWLCRKAWKQRKSGKRNGEHGLCPWEKALPSAHHLPANAGDQLQACWWGLRKLGLLQGSLFYWGHFQPT